MGMLQCLRHIWAERGVEGLYSGLQAPAAHPPPAASARLHPRPTAHRPRRARPQSKLWQTVLTAAVQLAIYERIAQLFLRAMVPRVTRKPSSP